MWVWIVGLILGNLLALAAWWHERRSHSKSRAALRFWRERAGLTEIPLDRVEDDMVAVLRALHKRGAA